MIESMHSISEFKAHSVFQGKRKLLTNPECKNIFNTVKNFRAKISRSKILNDKKIFQYSEEFQVKSVFQGKRKLLKNPE